MISKEKVSKTPTPSTDSLDSIMKVIKAKVKARVPMLWLVSDEEQRVQGQLAKKVCMPLGREIIVWSCHRGLMAFNGKVIDNKRKTLTQALEFISEHISGEAYTGATFLLLDPHPHITPVVARQLRDMHIPLLSGQPQKNSSKASTIIFLSGRVAHVSSGIVDGLEPSLQNVIDVIHIPLPTKKDLARELSTLIEHSKGSKETTVKLDYTTGEIDQFASSLQGLTSLEAMKAASESFALHEQIVVETLQEKKEQIVKRGGLIEVVHNLPTLEQVGGLDEVKKFISLYTGQFTEEAGNFGLEPLKAIMFVGIPGAGKSLCSKALASLWQLPCLRLDMGKIMQGIVGSSEANVRQVIKVAEASAPSVLIIDEIEKQMAGTQSSSFSDSGTTARVFGTLLTAMEEGLKGVVISATANDVQALPPELLRRFDEVFYVDLPVEEERCLIFQIHLGKRGRDSKLFDLDLLVKATYGFTGSEIEKSVKVGIAMAWRDRKELTTDYLLQAIGEMRPLSKIMSSKIEASRKWAEGRARRASSYMEKDKKEVDLTSLNVDLASLTGDIVGGKN